MSRIFNEREVNKLFPGLSNELRFNDYGMFDDLAKTGFYKTFDFTRFDYLTDSHLAELYVSILGGNVYDHVLIIDDNEHYLRELSDERYAIVYRKKGDIVLFEQYVSSVGL